MEAPPISVPDPDATPMQLEESEETRRPKHRALPANVSKEEFDFYPKTVDGQMLDSCGGTYALVHNPKIRYKATSVEYPDDYNGINLLDEKNSNGFGFELHLDGKMLHSRNASNWHNGLKVTDTNKTSVLNTILSDFIEV